METTIKGWLSTEQTAKALGVKRRQVTNLCHTGELRHRTVSGVFLIDGKSVAKFIETRDGPDHPGKLGLLEAAEYVGISRQRILVLMRAGKLTAFNNGKHRNRKVRYLFLVEELQKIKEERNAHGRDSSKVPMREC